MLSNAAKGLCIPHANETSTITKTYFISIAQWMGFVINGADGFSISNVLSSLCKIAKLQKRTFPKWKIYIMPLMQAWNSSGMFTAAIITLLPLYLAKFGRQQSHLYAHFIQCLEEICWWQAIWRVCCLSPFCLNAFKRHSRLIDSRLICNML